MLCFHWPLEILFGGAKVFVFSAAQSFCLLSVLLPLLGGGEEKWVESPVPRMFSEFFFS